MRVVMLVANPITFDGRVIRHAQTLAEAGHEVRVLGVLGPADRDQALPPGLGFTAWRLDRRRRGLLPRLCWAESGARQRLALRLCERLDEPRLARLPGVAELATATSAVELMAKALTLPCDVLHGNDLNTLPAAAWAGRLLRRPYVYDAHELYVDERPDMSPGERRSRRVAEARGARGAAAVLTVNELIADELARMYQIPAPVVVRNLPPLLRGAALRGPEDIPEGQPGTLRLLYQGAHIGLAQEGTDEMLQAVARVKDRIRVHLTMRGGLNAAQEREVRARVAALGIGEQVTLRPPVPGAAALVEAALAGGEELGLAVHPDICGSYRYTTSSKVYEYQGAGLAVCATDLVGNRLSVNEEAGVFYPPGDVARLAEIFVTLAQDRPRLTRMRRAARRRAEAELCWERERERLLGVYQRLAATS